VSSPGHGTTFLISLPILHRAAETSPSTLTAVSR
jgi:hypothetical protein